MAANTYSFLNTLCTLVTANGPITLGAGVGIAKEGITISFNEDKNTLVTGADGGWMTSLRASNSGTATVRLLKTSPTNATLNAQYRFETTSSANSGNDTLTITDPTRGDTTVCQGCSFRKAPDLVYSEDGDIMTYVFNVGSISEILGNGNPG